MKRILFAFLIVFSVIGKSYAPVLCDVCPDPSPSMYGCADASSKGCSGGYEYSTCNECLSGYTLTYNSSGTCGSFYSCTFSGGGTIQCDPACSDVWWHTISTGYQEYTYMACDTDVGTCFESDWAYRCASGYYGTTSNGTSGCTVCPSSGTSAAGSNSAITSCYLPTNYSTSDIRGTYKYTQSCYYSN